MEGGDKRTMEAGRAFVGQGDRWRGEKETREHFSRGSPRGRGVDNFLRETRVGCNLTRQDEAPIGSVEDRGRISFLSVILFYFLLSSVVMSHRLAYITLNTTDYKQTTLESKSEEAWRGETRRGRRR